MRKKSHSRMLRRKKRMMKNMKTRMQIMMKKMRMKNSWGRLPMPTKNKSMVQATIPQPKLHWSKRNKVPKKQQRKPNPHRNLCSNHSSLLHLRTYLNKPQNPHYLLSNSNSSSSHKCQLQPNLFLQWTPSPQWEAANNFNNGLLSNNKW